MYRNSSREERKLNLSFRGIKHILELLLDDEERFPASSIRLLNYPLIVTDVIIPQNILGMDTLGVPDKFSNIYKLIQDNFPVTTLKEFVDTEESFEKYVIREIISLYYLFCILKELRNLPITSKVGNGAPFVEYLYNVFC
ncbi:MAG TPA: hypothetical protein VEP90_24395 [Methylomirabilota bacterium]|nr:hypothetical protein [Methylomirabilota bacterium]